MDAFEQDQQPPTMMKRAAMQVAALSQKPLIILVQKFIIGIVGLVVVVDLFLYLNDTPGDTISNVLRDWAYERFFVVTWAWGVLGGHLFLTNPNPPLGSTLSIVLLLALTLALFVAGYFFFKGPIPVAVQAVLLLLGVIAGYVLWPQGPAPAP